MTPRIVGIGEAREFFAHPTQHTEDAKPEMLPSFGIDYIACGPICGAFRQGPWPGAFMADYGVKPEGWGHLVKPGRAILTFFWEMREPQVICGWTDKRNRAAVAFARRLGFRVSGELTLANGSRVVMQEWRP